jgi:hypothetical protein
MGEGVLCSCEEILRTWWEGLLVEEGVIIQSTVFNKWNRTSSYYIIRVAMYSTYILRMISR